MRWMTGEKGFVCCMARLESAPGTRDMLALHEALARCGALTDSPLDYHTPGKCHKRKMIGVCYSRRFDDLAVDLFAVSSRVFVRRGVLRSAEGTVTRSSPPRRRGGLPRKKWRLRGKNPRNRFVLFAQKLLNDSKRRRRADHPAGCDAANLQVGEDDLRPAGHGYFQRTDERHQPQHPATNASCPISTPTLTNPSATGIARCSSPTSLRAPAKPKPCNNMPADTRARVAS
jgi:hypothetical protein